MSIEDFEAAIFKQKADEATAKRQRDQKLAKQTKDSAASAATFLAMMKKYGIEPEPIYSHFQDRRKRAPVEVFKKVDEGWVVDYKRNSFNELWLISYLCKGCAGVYGTVQLAEIAHLEHPRYLLR